MNTVVDLVAEVVLKEIKETFNKTGESKLIVYFLYKALF